MFNIKMTKQIIRTVAITVEQKKWIKENCINFSAAVRKMLDNRIKKQKTSDDFSDW